MIFIRLIYGVIFVTPIEIKKLMIMKKALQLAAVITLIFLTACKTEKLNSALETDYLVFGHFYGECLGESCIETFKLTDTKLYEDISDGYSHSNYNFQQLTGEKFIAVKDLIDQFPNQLLTDSIQIYGCPDCRDQGGIYIEYVKNGVVRSWRIDMDKGTVPPYLHPFMDEVNDKISVINN